MNRKTLIYIPLLFLNLLSIYPLLVASHFLPPYHIKILLASPFQGSLDANVSPVTLLGFGGWLLRTFIVVVLPFFILLVTAVCFIFSDDIAPALVYVTKRFPIRAPIITLGFYPILVFFRLIPPYDITKIVQIPTDAFHIDYQSAWFFPVFGGTALGIVILVLGILPIAIVTMFTELDENGRRSVYDDYGKQRSWEKHGERSRR